MDISIIVLNYKQKGLVKQCVKGILASRPQLDYEIIVVDNKSSDGCIEEVEQLFVKKTTQPLATESFLPRLETPKPPLITVQSERNGGFAAGNNLGLRRARGRYVVVLNPDIAIVPQALEIMVAFMDQHPTVGIMGPKLINPDGSVQFSCRRFPRWQTPLFRRSFFGKLPFAKKELDHYLMSAWDHQQSQAVDWIFGACLVIRASLLEKIGLFDERFFMYFEDLDLCRRCWEAGSSVFYLSDVEMVHYHQRLSAEKSGILGIFDKAGRIHLKSGIKYFAKYLGVPLPRKNLD